MPKYGFVRCDYIRILVSRRQNCHQLFIYYLAISFASEHLQMYVTRNESHRYMPPQVFEPTATILSIEKQLLFFHCSYSILFPLFNVK